MKPLRSALGLLLETSIINIGDMVVNGANIRRSYLSVRAVASFADILETEKRIGSNTWAGLAVIPSTWDHLGKNFLYGRKIPKSARLRIGTHCNIWATSPI